MNFLISCHQYFLSKNLRFQDYVVILDRIYFFPCLDGFRPLLFNS